MCFKDDFCYSRDFNNINFSFNDGRYIFLREKDFEGIENKAIAFMIISFKSPVALLDKHNCDETRNYIRHTAMEISVYLEVNRLTQELK